MSCENIINFKKLYKKSGIYKLINNVNHNIYIGSSVNFYNRLKEHFRDLERNTHYNEYLQRAYNKYNKNFTFEIIEECDKELLFEKEQYWIDLLKPHYNMMPVAGRPLNFKYKDNHLRIEKLSRKLRKLTDEQIKQINVMIDNKTSLSIIAKLYNVHPSTISRIKNCRSYKDTTNREKVKINKNIKPGKLQDKDIVYKIQKDLLDGISQYVIAKKYGLNQSTISRINTKTKNFKYLKNV